VPYNLNFNSSRKTGTGFEPQLQVGQNSKAVQRYVRAQKSCPLFLYP